MEKERIEEIKKTALLRYGKLSGKPLMLYHTTTDGLNYHVVEVEKESDDIAGLLEAAFHDIGDRFTPYLKNGELNLLFDNAVYTIMGAVKEEELDETLKEYEEYTNLDLGYVIPGLIDVIEFCKED